MDPRELFPTETDGLPTVATSKTVRLRDGEHFELRIAPVRKRFGDADVRMLAYNGSIPGPTLHVDQGSEITVRAVNEGDIETTVHWHGLRLANRSDGVPDGTQPPIAIGGDYTCNVRFPDAGVYWYHPHLREDFAQEMGLYATVIVEPSDPAYWPAADRQLSITLDDILIEDGRMAPFKRSGPTFTAMGRFGNVFLINGETRLEANVTAGEVVRLYLVNTANTRIFNIAVPGARMKLIGGDSGRCERETFVEEILLAPSERAVVDVLFTEAGDVHLEHRTPDRVYDLGTFTVAAGTATNAARSFDVLRVDPELTLERRSIARDIARQPDKVLAFVASMPLLYGSADAMASVYACPMHPEVTDTGPSTCPKCGMKLVPQPARSPAKSYVCPMHAEVTSSAPGTCPKCGMKLVAAESSSLAGGESGATAPHAGHGSHAGHAGRGAAEGPDGLEWEDLMPGINRASDPGNMIWKLVDRASGAENHAIAWRFTVGDRVKIRLVNEMDSDHPMPHPFHVHGAGRLLILSRDGAPETNLMWKDTVLVRAGETVDVLLDVTNPGVWMAHCHIAEHIESGMMFSFEVAPRADAGISAAVSGVLPPAGATHHHGASPAAG